nr:hypothetical conserved protein [uncultured Gammaproteobacteria bacterium]
MGPLWQLPLYGAAGALAGLVAGLFGLGGGVVLVPALLFLYAWQGFPPESIPVAAVATSLATVAVTAAASAWAHHKLGSLDWQAVWRLAPGVVLGSGGGAWLAERLPGGWLKTLFAAYLLAVAAQMVRGFPSPAGQAPPRLWVYGGAGSLIGALSAMLGIGGGTLTVPFLLWSGFPIRRAVAVASALGVPIALAGTLSYALLGLNAPSLPPGSLGYVYLPAFSAISAASLVTAPMGARLAHRLPSEVLKRLFALSLALIGLKLWYGH